MSVILAITGASGCIYSIRLLEVLLAAGLDVHLSISGSGQAVLKQELDIDVDLDRFEPDRLVTPANPRGPAAELLRSVLRRASDGTARLSDLPGRVVYHHYQNLLAPIASGSFRAGGMVVCPCSGATLSAIAHAASSNLIQRAAEVQLKERRKLILVPRETPLSLPQLDNMLRATQAGAIVLPASPGWYHGVTGIRDLVDFVVARVCDQLGVENTLIRRWGTGNGN